MARRMDRPRRVDDRAAGRRAVADGVGGEQAASGSVGAAHIDAAYELWSGYYLPHALAVFDRAGAGQGTRKGRSGRAPRRAAQLKRVRAPEISREDVRREALCQSVDARGAEEVLARLRAGGFYGRWRSLLSRRGAAPAVAAGRA